MLVRVGAPVAALLMTAGLAACGSSKDDGGSTSANAPIRVALIPPSSGALEVFGADGVKAWRYAAAEVNAKGGVDGHRVEIVVKESDGTPAGTLRAARAAVTSDSTHFISGIITSAENAALAPALTSLNAIVVNGMSKDDSLTGKTCSANAFRTTVSTGMDVRAIAKTLAHLPAKTWAIQATDYLNGHTAANVFAAAAKQAGKQVVLTQFAPLNTNDYGSYITKIRSSGADGIFAQEQGADGVAFIDQGSQFKLFGGKTVVGFNMIAEPQFKALGDKIVGFYNNLTYSPEVSNPANDAFVKGWTAKFGKAPYYIDGDTYLTAQFLFAAVRKARSVDPQKVRAVMDDLELPDSIVGDVSMRPQDHQLQRETYVGQIVKKPGGVAGLGWKIAERVPASQTSPAADPACKIAN
jgi:branched-chain amino acid transport system substrate-binding protein